MFRGSERDRHVEHVRDDLLPQAIDAAAGDHARSRVHADATHQIQTLGESESHALQDCPSHFGRTVVHAQTDERAASGGIEVGSSLAAEVR